MIIFFYILAKKYLPVKQIALSCILVFYVTLIFAQEQKINGITPSIQLNYSYGSVNNTKDIPNQSSAHYIQLSVLNATGSQDSSFFNLYKKPHVGFTALYGYLGESDVLGSVFSVYPTWEYTYFTDKSLGLNLKFGTGFAYFTRSYDKVTNPDFMVIGRKLTNITDISPSVWFKFSPNFYAYTGVSFLHFSNGHTSIPNIGLNDMTVRVGVTYKPGTLVGLSVPKRKTIVADTIWRKTIAVGLGRHKFAKTTFPVDGPSYNIYKLSGYISKQIKTIHELQFGLSVAFYNSYYSCIKFEEYYKHFKPILSTQTTFHIGHEFLLNRFGFVTQLGLKIFDPFYRSYFLDKNEYTFERVSKSLMSTKVGFKYYPIKNSFAGKKLAMGMFIKTNYVIADYVEYSISYTF